jgi:hypothetical protein
MQLILIYELIYYYYIIKYGIIINIVRVSQNILEFKNNLSKN